MTYMFDTDIIGYLIRGSSLALKGRFEVDFHVEALGLSHRHSPW